MKYTKYMQWSPEWAYEEITHTTYNKHIEKVLDIMRNDVNHDTLIATWLEDENGKRVAYFDKHIQLITGEEEMKKATKEEVLDEVYDEVAVERWGIEDILDVLEEYRYIEFKEKYKEYKVFVKTVIVYEGAKDLYYVTDSLYTDNIDEAKRFELDEEKDGYAYEIVKESV